MQKKWTALSYPLGLACTLIPAGSLLYLCWMLTPLLWNGRLPAYFAVGFYALVGMLLGLLGVLVVQLHHAHRARRASRTSRS